MSIDAQGLLKALTPQLVTSVELAIDDAAARGHAEVRIEHVLYQALDVEGADLRSLLPEPARLTFQLEIGTLLDELPFDPRGGAPLIARELFELLGETRAEVSAPRAEPRIRGAALLERLVARRERYLPFELVDAASTLGQEVKSGSLRRFVRPIASREELAARQRPRPHLPLPPALDEAIEAPEPRRVHELGSRLLDR